MPQAHSEVLAERYGPVLVLTLNRPEVRNALNGALVRRLIALLDDAGRDPDVRAVVLAGAPPAFSSGADLRELSGGDHSEAIDRVELTIRLHALIPALRIPVLAAVGGPAVAGGCGLAMSCDIVVASREASFGYPEVRRGLVAAIVMVSLERLVGRRAALDLLLSGRRIDAQEAKDLGMVTEVVPAGAELARTLERAHELAAHPPGALGKTKELFYRVGDLPYETALGQAGTANLLMRRADEGREGATAFVEKKAPRA
ncbi:MAG: enoyl-CoA hydratase/isomerase family protein [Gaiellaceae bacterium]